MSFETKIIRQHGGDPGCLFRFDNENDGQGWNLLPYATLTAARNAGELTQLIGVYEWQNRPLFLLVDGDALDKQENGLTRIRRIAAMRGDAPYLAVVRAGRLTIHDVGLDNEAHRSKLAIGGTEDELRMIIPNLVNERPIALDGKRRWINDVILKLLTDALDTLTGSGINVGDAISFAGRALFIRFLADRELLSDNVIAIGGDRGLEGLFDRATHASATSKWLDDTFNGDFLPLSAATIRSFPPQAFDAASNIMLRAADGQLPLQWAESWENLDFAHIPVGVLSQVYEQYLGKKHKTKQKKEGSFYTPAHIAELMVHATFAALRRDGVAHEAKILDPAAGAGVFLITAFRQLVRERWMHDRKRPNTKTIREILYDQICGFDINDSALRFAALGLYLMAIELDNEPAPVAKLKFPGDLRKSVILKLGKDDSPEGSKDLGSLGDDVGLEHVGRYDLVIGNPPWASNTNLPEWQSVLDRVAHIASERGEVLHTKEHLSPNGAPDLPFVWRAMEWAKPNAQIAYALHGRLLFQRGEGMDVAFRSILGSINVTGIINGAEVRQSDVWPNVAAPFCLLFARNTLPPPGASFRFVSPHLEGPLSKKGGWRIDTAHAENVAIAEVKRHPETLKALYRGTRLDFDIFERLASNGFPSFGEYWAKLHGGTPRQPKCAGNGYKRLFETSRPNPSEGGLRGQAAEQMYDLPVLEHQDFDRVLLNVPSFKKFRSLGIERLDQRRALELYNGPMLLVRKSLPVGMVRLQTAVSFQKLAFNETYYGYTAHLHDSGNDMVKYLSLVVGSKFVLWHSLVTSGEFGVEREVVEKYVIQEVPIKPFDQLSTAEVRVVRKLFDLLEHDNTKTNWQKVDDWVGTLFGLTPNDIQVISDTLEWNLPFAKNRNAAQAPSVEEQRKEFATQLKFELDPWAERFGRPLQVECIDAPPLSPWNFVHICNAGSQNTERMLMKIAGDPFLDLADSLSSSEIVYHNETTDSLIIGRLNQARYWSKSQARLAARRIIWDHMNFLSGNEAA
jgi:N-6 DNA Methylase